MRKFSMPMAALAAVAFAGFFQPADLDAIQVQQQQQAQDRQQATDSIEATIAERENGTFVVTTRGGERLSFHTNDQTRVDDREGRDLQALQSGEAVLIHYRAIATRIEERELDPQQREQQQMQRGQQATNSVHGTLGQRENGSFTVLTQAGERKTFHLEDPTAGVQEREQTQARQQVEQIQEGQPVTVHYRAIATNIELRDGAQRMDPQQQQQQRQQRDPVQQQRDPVQQQRTPQQQQQDRDRQHQLSGSVQGTVAQRENGSFVITTDDGERIHVQTDPQTRVGVWQDRNLDALEAGESIRIDYRAIATRVEPRQPRDDARMMDPQERERMERERMEQMQRGQQNEATDSIHGTLIERDDGEFAVMTEAGERKTFYLEDRSREQPQPAQPRPAQPQQELGLDRLQEGQPVTVHFRTVATRIEVRQGAAPGQQDARQRTDTRQTDAQQAREDRQRQEEQRQERETLLRQNRDRQEATDSIVGSVAERENGTFVVLTREGERMSFEVDPQAGLTQRLQNVEDLPEGEPIVVRYRTIVTKVESADDAVQTDPQDRQERERMERERMAYGDEHQATDSIRGTLAERENGSFTLVTETGERKTFHLDHQDDRPQQRQMEQREREQGGQQIDLDRFEEGQALIVHYRAVATEIERREGARR